MRRPSLVAAGRLLLAVLALAGTAGCAGPSAAQRASTAPWCVDWATEARPMQPGGVACPRPEHRIEVARNGVVTCRCERTVPVE